MKRQIGIRWKLIAISMFVTFTCAATLGTALVFYNLSLFEQNTTSRVTTQAKVIAQSINAAMSFQDERTTLEQLESLLVDDLFLAAAVYDQDGELFTAAARSVESHELLPVRLDQGVHPENSMAISAAQPIKIAEETLGHVLIFASREQLANHSAQLLQATALVSVLALLISLVLSSRLQRTISTPLHKLANLSKQVRESRDYSLRSDIARTDEIGSLARHFNSMLGTIQKRDFEMESAVRQRTVELERLTEDFRHQALHDALTGLPNRVLFGELLLRSMASADRENSKFAVVFLDLDNFKTINDDLGHDTGDRLLVNVAERLQATVREKHSVCRLGGDEFTIILANLEGRDQVKLITDRIMQAIRRPIDLDGQKLHITMSMGASLYPNDGRDLDALRRYADVALYSAKAQGRNKFAFFSEEMKKNIRERHIIQNDLRAAADQGELELYYQPRVDGQSGKILGLEALLRWNHPNLGFLTPDRFIHYAEESQQILELDLWAIQQACTQLRAWESELGIRTNVSVNMSGTHFRSGQIVSTVQDILSTSGLAPDQLELELTEATLIDQSEQSLNVLNSLRELGVSMSLDDFGTGYSSLSYLRSFPVDLLKIDKSFVLRAPHSAADLRLMLAIIAMARSFDLKVVAEGVETRQHVDLLLRNQCNLMQGFYFSRPCDARNAAALLAEPQIPAFESQAAAS